MQLSTKGKNIFLKNHTVEKLNRRIKTLSKYIWQIDHYSNPTNKQLIERDKFNNQKEAMIQERLKRAA